MVKSLHLERDGEGQRKEGRPYRQAEKKRERWLSAMGIEEG